MKELLTPIGAIVTIIFHFFIVKEMKLLDNYFSIVLIILSTIAIGFYLKKPINKTRSYIGLGLFFGSLFSIISLAAFTIFLVLYWPK